MHRRPTQDPTLSTCLVAVIAASFLVACASSAPPDSPASPAPTAAPPSAAGTQPVDIPELVRQAEPSVVTVLAGNGVGSGIVYKDDGTIVTNAHVVADARRATVAFADGKQVTATVRAADRDTDVAVLQADRGGLTAARFQRELPQVGEPAIVIGSPLGFEATVTSGIIPGCTARFPARPPPEPRWST